MVPMAVDSMWIHGVTWFLWLWIPCGYVESHDSYGCGFHVDTWSHMVPMAVDSMWIYGSHMIPIWLWIPCGYMESHGKAVDSMWIYGSHMIPIWLWIPCGYMESHDSYGCGFHVDTWSHMIPMAVDSMWIHGVT